MNQTKKTFKRYLVNAASKVFDQLNAQFDEVSNRVQELTAKPYKESVSIYLIKHKSNSNKQLKSGFEQQKKFVKIFRIQIKSTQKLYVDFI